MAVSAGMAASRPAPTRPDGFGSAWSPRPRCGRVDPSQRAAWRQSGWGRPPSPGRSFLFLSSRLSSRSPLAMACTLVPVRISGGRSRRFRSHSQPAWIYFRIRALPSLEKHEPDFVTVHVLVQGTIPSANAVSSPNNSTPTRPPPIIAKVSCRRLACGLWFDVGTLVGAR